LVFFAFSDEHDNVPSLLSVGTDHKTSNNSEENKMQQLIFIIAACLAIIMPINRLCDDLAIAAENPHVANDGAVAPGVPLLSDIKAAIPQGVVVAKQQTKKLVIKRKKSRKKLKVKTPQQVESVGEKLTVSQVLETLKTSKDLSGKNMSGLQLVGMNMSGSNLKGSDLSHANLERADLGEANLERANLTGANLKMANLRMAGIPAANLDLAILDGAIWLDGKICAKASYGACKDNFQPFIMAMPAATSPASTVQSP